MLYPHYQVVNRKRPREDESPSEELDFGALTQPVIKERSPLSELYEDVMFHGVGILGGPSSLPGSRLPSPSGIPSDGLEPFLVGSSQQQHFDYSQFNLADYTSNEDRPPPPPPLLPVATAVESDKSILGRARAYILSRTVNLQFD